MPENITEEIPDSVVKVKDFDSDNNNNSNGDLYWDEQKVNPLTRDTFEKFSFSRNYHINFFQNKHYDELLYGRKIPKEEYNLAKYQNLLIFSFITDNISEGAKILEIGNGDDAILNHFKYQRECYRLENPEFLLKEADVIEKNNSQFIKSIEGKLLNGLPKNNFDFIFLKSGLDYISSDEKSLKTIFENIHLMLKPSGYALFSFRGKLIAPYVLCNPFCKFIIKSMPFRKGEFSTLTESVNHNKILNDPDLCDFENTEKFDKDIRIASYNYLWRKTTPFIASSSTLKPNQYLKNAPAFIFHHIIKCGGTSLANVIGNWFRVEVDRVEFSDDVNEFIKYKLNLLNISSDTCIVSHFQYDGVFLHQRYPELIENKDEVKIFTFIREPLNFRASLYYYTRHNKHMKNFTLEQVISNDNNLISKLIPCDETNYKEMLDRYFFIGIVERMQESFNLLADLINKKRITLPYSNKSSKDDQLSKLTPEFKAEFKKNNKLDYMIYEYCLEKFNKILSEKS